MATKKAKSQIQKRAPKVIRENKHDGTKFSFTCKGEPFEMNDMQNLFCMKYVDLQFNGAKAAEAAGYIGDLKTLASQASRLLTNDNIKRYVEILKNDIALQVGKSAVDIAREFAKIGFANIKNFYKENGELKQPHELDEDDAAAVSSVEYDDILLGREKIGTTTKIKRYDKVAALEKYARMIGADGVTKIAQTDTDGNDIVEII